MTGGVEQGGCVAHIGERMPGPGVRGGVPHAVQQFVAAGDELLEVSRGAGEELLDDHGRVVLHHGEAGHCPPREGARGRSALLHATGLPDRRRAAGHPYAVRMTYEPAQPDAHNRSPRPSLTPPDFASALAQPRMAPGASIAPAPASPPAVPVKPRAGRTAPVWIIGIIVLILIGLVGYFLNAIGPAASIIGMLLALVPLVAVLLAVRIIDRWEPEPRGLLVLAVAWGAVAAVGHRPRDRPAHHDGLSGTTTRRCGMRSRPSSRRRSWRSSRRAWASTSSSDRPARFRRSGGRRRVRSARRRRLRVHREHPVLRDQPDRGRSRRRVDDVLRARHPVAVRPRDVHQRHGIRARAGGAPRRERGSRQSARGCSA